MTQRLNVYKAAPKLYKATLALSQAVGEGIDPGLKYLMELRASQINKCAFCIDMHTKDARHHGETEERISLVAAFDEADEFFSEKERAALALTEAVTVLTDGHVPDEVYERVAKHWTEPEIAQLIGIITVINAWNRINVSARTPGGHYKPGQYA
ncbi:carboxymuconolactone decarboxylase family protein [Streptomyces boninensis]|uniref:carboxymuconolactone decarboxylase family protein n=1 Tax=Streptomyces boninensis TaxID=2039455 RepID=UPI003B21C064